MKHNRKAQKVRFILPLEDDELNELIEVVEIYYDENKIRCIIKTLELGKYKFTKSALADDMDICDN
jgi:hypothetical protein